MERYGVQSQLLSSAGMVPNVSMTSIEVLRLSKKELEDRLTRVNAALALVEKNPQFVEFLEAFERARW